MLFPDRLEEVLRAVGDLLEAEGVQVGVVVVGGASLNLLGFVSRTTDDIDVIARVEGAGCAGREAASTGTPAGCPGACRRQGRARLWVATNLDEHGGRGTVAAGAASVAGRRTLIALKLFAAVDQGPRSVHYQDLVMLAPAADELEHAVGWVRMQDASDVFASMLDQVIDHVLRDTQGSR